MIDYKQMELATEELVQLWGQENADRVTAFALKEYKEMTVDEFLKECIACGGDWGAMLLTGIKVFFPKTWDAIPNDMGHNAFAALLCTLCLCGVKV